MVITGSAIFVQPGSDRLVVERLKHYPHLTFQAKSDAGTELVVNLEAEDLDELENLSCQIKNEISEIVDIAHIYVNFEEEIEKIQAGERDKRRLTKPKFFEDFD